MIRIQYATGNNLYAISLRDAGGGDVWNTSTSSWVTPVAGDWGSYDIPLVEIAGTGIYQLTLPENSGGFSFDDIWVYNRVGASPAPSDTVVERLADIGWNKQTNPTIYVGSTSGGTLAWPYGSSPGYSTSLAHAETIITTCALYNARIHVVGSASYLSPTLPSTYAVSFFAATNSDYPSLTPSAGCAYAEGFTLMGGQSGMMAVNCKVSTSGDFTPGYRMVDCIIEKCTIKMPADMGVLFENCVFGAPPGVAYSLVTIDATSTGGTSYLTLLRCGGAIASISAAPLYELRARVVDCPALALSGSDSNTRMDVYGLTRIQSGGWKWFNAYGPTNISTFNASTDGVLLASGAIHKTSFDLSTAFPLESEDANTTHVMRDGDDGVTTGSSLDQRIDDDILAPLDRIHDALIETVINDVTGTVTDGAWDACSPVSWSSWFLTKNNDYMSVSRSGGYTGPSYAAIYIPFSRALLASEFPFADETVTARFYVHNISNSPTVALVWIADPSTLLPLSGVNAGDLNTSGDVVLSSSDIQTDGTLKWVDIDITNLLNSIQDDLGGDVYGIMMLFYPPGNNDIINIRTLEGGSQFAATVTVSIPPAYEAKDLAPTAQEMRDAMMLAPSAGTPAAGSVDKHLDDIEAAIATVGAGSGTGTYTDTVMDGSTPLDGVRVQLSTDSAGNNRVYEAWTDALGVFTMHPDPGTYYSWFDLAGYTFTQGAAVVVT